jgi:elongation factor P--(R)-beta-lysine ligase
MRSPSLAMLTRRSALLRQLRQFFYDRDFIEVDTPLLADEIIPELHIEPFPVGDCPLFLSQSDEAGDNHKQEKGTVPLAKMWLQASPELHMKLLLVAGAKAIFQVTRSFRQGERGQIHNPEFTMVEWYRVGDDMAAGIELVDQLTQLLLSAPPAKRTSYAAAFQEHAGICPHTTTVDQLAAAAAEVATPHDLDRTNRDQWLNLLLAMHVESQLGSDRPEILYHYPASQAALAKTTIDAAGNQVAERFELYYRGIELANGYHELADAAELRRRFAAANVARAAEGRRALPLPEKWLTAMEQGLPDCTGVALGFDRLMMLAVGASTIDEVLAFASNSRC